MHAELSEPVCPRLGGKFRVTRGKGSVVIEETPWLDNIITGTGRAGLAESSFSTLTPYCHVGSGEKILLLFLGFLFCCWHDFCDSGFQKLNLGPIDHAKNNGMLFNLHNNANDTHSRDAITLF